MDSTRLDHHLVVELLLASGHVPAGEAGRLAAVSRGCRRAVLTDGAFFWERVARERMHLTTFPGIPAVVASLRHTKRCRECGDARGLPTRPAGRGGDAAPVFVCRGCAREAGGYSELVGYDVVFGRAPQFVWSRKRRALLAGMHLAQKTPHSRHLYWAYEWRRKRQPLFPVQKNVGVAG